MRSAIQTLIRPVTSGLSKQIQFFLLIMVSTITLFMSSCKKKDPSPVTPQNSLNTYFEGKHTAATQSFVINSGGANMLYGSKGTRIIFESSAFTTHNGTPVTGMVTINLIEAPNYREMLHLNTQTIGTDGIDEKLLVSGGQIKLTAIQNGIELRIVPGKATVEMPLTSVDPNMAVFYGTENTDGNLVWTQSTTDTVTVGSDSLGSYYQFPISDLGWINCDDFYDSASPLTNVIINLPLEYNATNSVVWMVFPSINSVMNVDNNANSQFTGYNLPEGMNAIIIVLTKVDDVYSKAIVPIIITTSQTETITLTTTTLADFETEIDNL